MYALGFTPISKAEAKKYAHFFTVHEEFTKTLPHIP